MLNANQLLGTGQTGQGQAVNSSQVIGSHLIQQPRMMLKSFRQVQNVAVQPQNSYFSQPQQPLQQTGFYQQAASGLQTGIQQVTSPTQFSAVQGFGQPPNLNILQPSAQSLGLAPGQPLNKPMSFGQPPSQQQDVSKHTSMTASQMRSPPHSLNPTNLAYQPAVGTPSQSPNLKQHKDAANVNTKAGIKPRHVVGQQQMNPKMNFVGQPVQPGQVIRGQLMVNSVGSMQPQHHQQARYQNPIQQPGIPVMLSHQQQTQHQPPPQQLPQRPVQQSHSAIATSHGGAAISSIKAQQAKQRQELLQHAQSFLNPDKVDKAVVKPDIKPAVPPTSEVEKKSTEDIDEKSPDV